MVWMWNILYQLMCLNMWCQTVGMVKDGCGALRRWSLTGEGRSLGMALDVLQHSSTSCLFFIWVWMQCYWTAFTPSTMPFLPAAMSSLSWWIPPGNLSENKIFIPKLLLSWHFTTVAGKETKTTKDNLVCVLCCVIVYLYYNHQSIRAFIYLAEIVQT